MKKPALWPVIMWSVRRKCPNCGSGKLFAGYLKPVDKCTACGEAFGHIRCDDGPAWLTILIVGHMLAPFLYIMATGNSWPDWVAMTVWPALAVVLILMILPFSKGLFVGVIWRSNCIGAEK